MRVQQELQKQLQLDLVGFELDPDLKMILEEHLPSQHLEGLPEEQPLTQSRTRLVRLLDAQASAVEA